MKNSCEIGNMAVLKCPKCKVEFAIDSDFMGVITCPYCGGYVEG